MKLLLVLGLVLGVACGPSTSEVRTAKLAHYTVAPETLFDIALQVTQRDYKIGDTDAASGQILTAPQFYSAEGTRQSAGAGGFIQMDANSIMLQLIVEIRETDAGHAIAVTPKTFQMVPGSPKPRELAPDDPNVPGWVHGRVDSLAVSIYDAAKQYAVR